MDYILEGLKEAEQLIFWGDPEVWGIVFLSLRVSAMALTLATALGVPSGFLIATRQFRGKRGLVTVLNTLMALPTVVVGLTVYAFLSRRGPLGPLGLLYTPEAMVIGQFLLALPIVTALVLAAIQGVDRRVRPTALTLGASQLQAAWAVLSEARFAVLAAIAAGFGRVIAEVGAAMILGGNIRGFTRTMTTAIALETGKGEFGLAMALGIILLAVAFSINLLFHYLQGLEQP